jgi:hypothetical protein
MKRESILQGPVAVGYSCEKERIITISKKRRTQQPK